MDISYALRFCGLAINRDSIFLEGAQAMQWEFEPGHSAAEFRCRHMMVTWVRGHFNNVRGSLLPLEASCKCSEDLSNKCRKANLENENGIAVGKAQDMQRRAHCEEAWFWLVSSVRLGRDLTSVARASRMCLPSVAHKSTRPPSP